MSESLPIGYRVNINGCIVFHFISPPKALNTCSEIYKYKNPKQKITTALYNLKAMQIARVMADAIRNILKLL